MKYSTQDIYNDFLIQEFLDRNITERTRHAHVNTIRDYCNYLNKLPTEFIEDADIEQDENIKLKMRTIKKRLNSYIKRLKKQGKVPNAV